MLMHPSANDGGYSLWRMLLVDIPIFLSASLPAAVFYICAQRELYPKSWLKEILLLPMVLALGVGLAINNARAVIEAIFGHQSEFTRTPKYGIERKTQSWKGARYLPLKSLLPFVELGVRRLLHLPAGPRIPRRSMAERRVPRAFSDRFRIRRCLLAGAMVSSAPIPRPRHRRSPARLMSPHLLPLGTDTAFPLGC